MLFYKMITKKPKFNKNITKNEKSNKNVTKIGIDIVEIFAYNINI